MNDNDSTILDQIDHIQVRGRVFEKPANEYWALFCLWQGLEFLNIQAAHSDDVVKQQLNPDGKIRIAASGNLPVLHQIPQQLLTCAFLWYSVTACQYVRAVGAIACRNDESRPKPIDYVRYVIPEVLAYRDKVGAHFAWSTQNTKDSDSERLASIIPQLTFINDSFHVGALTVYRRCGGKASNSETIKPWNICEVHKRLRKRYWPDQQADPTP